MCVTTEDFKEFIGDEKYVGVRKYLLSAFKCVDKLTDLIINDPKCPYGILTKNTPLMVSNGLCLLVMGYELIKESNVFKRRQR